MCLGILDVIVIHRTSDLPFSLGYLCFNAEGKHEAPRSFRQRQKSAHVTKTERLDTTIAAFWLCIYIYIGYVWREGGRERARERERGGCCACCGCRYGNLGCRMTVSRPSMDGRWYISLQLQGHSEPWWSLFFLLGRHGHYFKGWIPHLQIRPNPLITGYINHVKPLLSSSLDAKLPQNG